MMTSKPKILVLIGLPASGKSTYAKDWVQRDPEFRRRVNYDDERLVMFGPGWRWNRKEEETMKRVVRQKVSDMVNAGLSVVIDNTNLSKNVRESWKQLAQSLGATYEDHEIDTPLGECIKRDLRREARVGRAVIERMALFYGMIDWNDYEGEFVIVDLDGTVADCSHRLKYLEPTIHHKMDCKDPSTRTISLDTGAERCPQCGVKATKNWKAFHEAENLMKDPEIFQICRLVREYFLVGYHVLYVTGRGLESAIATEDWMNQAKLFDGEWSQHLFMRQAGDHKPDTEAKKEILDLLPKDRIAYVLDDRERVVEMYRNEGLTVLNPKKGDY